MTQVSKKRLAELKVYQALFDSEQLRYFVLFCAVFNGQVNVSNFAGTIY